MDGEVVSIKAPGKIILIGGYSALEAQNVAFVAAVDSYATVSLKQNSGTAVLLDAPQLKMSANCRLDKLTGELKAEVPKELLLFKTAAEVSLRYVSALGVPVSGFDLSSNTDAEFAYSISSGRVVKSGLGSSAAITVAAVGSVLKAFGVSFSDNEALHKLSQIAHYVATGKTGSGIDITASAYGSVICTRCPSSVLKSLPTNYTNKQLLDLVKSSWDQKIERFSMPKGFRLSYATFGDAMITAEAVKRVYEFKERDPHIYADVIREINDENVRAISALRLIKKGDANSMDEFRNAFDKGRSLTKKLGVLSGVGIEPDDCTQLIEESKRNGAFVAKLPGAGGKDAIAALSTDDNSYRSLTGFWKGRKDIRLLDVGIIADGAKSAKA